MVVTKDTILDSFDFAFSVLSEQIALLTRDVFSDQGPTELSAKQLRRQVKKVFDTFVPVSGFLKLGVENYPDLGQKLARLDEFLNRLPVIYALFENPAEAPTVAQACVNAADLLRNFNREISCPIYQGLVVHAKGAEQVASSLKAALADEYVALRIIPLDVCDEDNLIQTYHSEARGKNLLLYISPGKGVDDIKSVFRLGLLLGGLKTSSYFCLKPSGTQIRPEICRPSQTFDYPVGDTRLLEESIIEIANSVRSRLALTSQSD